MADNKSCEENYEFLTKEEHKERHRSIGTLTVDLDVADALKGLKAVQREARNTTAALKELEEAYNIIQPVAEQCGVSEEEIVAALLTVKGDVHNAKR